jgi:hypothetical protein
MQSSSSKHSCFVAINPRLVARIEWLRISPVEAKVPGAPMEATPSATEVQIEQRSI